MHWRNRNIFGPDASAAWMFTGDPGKRQSVAQHADQPAPGLEAAMGHAGASSGIDWQSGPGCYGRPIHLDVAGPPATASPVFPTESAMRLRQDLSRGHRYMPEQVISRLDLSSHFRCDLGRTRPDIVAPALPALTILAIVRCERPNRDHRGPADADMLVLSDNPNRTHLSGTAAS